MTHTKNVKSEVKWPKNSEFVLTINEILKAMPRLNITNIRITKPTKPNGRVISK